MTLWSVAGEVRLLVCVSGEHECASRHRKKRIRSTRRMSGA